MEAREILWAVPQQCSIRDTCTCTYVSVCGSTDIYRHGFITAGEVCTVVLFHCCRSALNVDTCSFIIPDGVHSCCNDSTIVRHEHVEYLLAWISNSGWNSRFCIP